MAQGSNGSKKTPSEPSASKPPTISAECNLKCQKCGEIAAHLHHELPEVHDPFVQGYLLGRVHHDCPKMKAADLLIGEPRFAICESCGRVRTVCQVAYPQLDPCCEKCTHPIDHTYVPTYRKKPRVWP